MPHKQARAGFLPEDLCSAARTAPQLAAIAADDFGEPVVGVGHVDAGHGDAADDGLAELAGGDGLQEYHESSDVQVDVRRHALERDAVLELGQVVAVVDDRRADSQHVEPLAVVARIVADRDHAGVEIAALRHAGGELRSACGPRPRPYRRRC